MSISSKFSGATNAASYIAQVAKNDDANRNNCGRGVRNILKELGVPHLSREETGEQDGHKWSDYLRSDKMQDAGWKEVDWKTAGWSPEKSPLGVVWVYPHDKNPTGNGGRRYGHVEIAIKDGYASGDIFKNPGGTVRHNEPVAFIHPKLEAFANGGNVPEDQVKAILKSTVKSAQEQQKKAAKDNDTVRIAQNFETASQNIDAMDFSNIDFTRLIEMILNILAGHPIQAPYPRQDTPVPDTAGPVATDDLTATAK